jgi:hypothetical protein
MDKNEHLSIIVEDLCEYALDREDIKWIADNMPDHADLSSNKLEYELHLLKIVTVGWCISYYLQDEPAKKKILEPFWQNIQEVSRGLSQATSLFIGSDIDYFKILKSRLDAYVIAMSRASDDNPALAIGPEFAEHCGDPDDLFAFMAGSRMFMTAAGGVKEYLQAAGFCVS